MLPNNQYSQFGQLGALPSTSAGTGMLNATSPIAGYDQQIANNRLMADKGYSTLSGNYDAIAADALATRERNMGRIDQYGKSMRSDLDIKSRQALAAAQQSAIKRGLGNTTVTDSLVRGQTFDNNRQLLTLEDQLLQNRISTDASLSNTYQNVLQNRAQGLASQWNTNMANENQLTGQRLNYAGNLYTQQVQMQNQNQQNLYQMQNQNEQAQIERDLRYPKQAVQKWTYSGGAFGGGTGNAGWGRG